MSGLQVGSKRDGGKGSIAGAASALGSSMTRQAPRELGADGEAASVVAGDAGGDGEAAAARRASAAASDKTAHRFG